jgi:predicted DNA-binding antitoxin AbrB/MazE fold protein
MALTIEATYENGVLKPVQPLPLIQEGTHLWLTIHIAAEEDCLCF